MGVIERLIKATEASERRLNAARTAVSVLTKEEKQRLLVEIVRELEQPALPTTDASAAPVIPIDGSYVDACEAVLAAHPQGLTSAEIGELIGQERPSADSTVRWLRQSRKNVGRQGDKWVLLRPSKKPLTNRDVIKQVLAEAGKPMRAGEIIAGVMKVKPDANANTLHAELMRLRTSLKEVDYIPGNPPVGGLYSLPEGGVENE